MNIVARIKELAAEKDLTIAELERILGFGNNVISKWDKSIPRSDKLERLADYFQVSTDYLLGRTEARSKTFTESTCPYCGLMYIESDPDDYKTHLKYHRKYMAAVRKFGGAVIDAERQKFLQEYAHQTLHTPTATTEEKYDAFLDLCTCYFTRSLAASDWSLQHVNFSFYMAMLLNQEHTKERVPKELYDMALAEYGKFPGLENGSTYYEIRLLGFDDEELLERYHELDYHGKEMVDTILELEWKRIYGE